MNELLHDLIIQCFHSVAKDYVRLMKYGDSLYRCKQLKRAALGRYVRTQHVHVHAADCIGPCLSYALTSDIFLVT